MYSQTHYLSRSILALQLSELPENIRRRKAYIALAKNWREMAEVAAKVARPT